MTTKRKRPRTCVACRSECSKRTLLRIVRTPDGDIVLDPTGRQPGRGAYLCLNRDCIETAIKKDALSRALRIKVRAEIYDEILHFMENSREKGPE